MRSRSERGRVPGLCAPGEAFLCEHCHTTVPADAPGTKHRNHCPNCLWSLHLDVRAGDRRSGCRGSMEPIGISVRPDGEWALLHRCAACGLIRLNRLAGDDNPLLLLSLAVRPLGRPPFPLAHLREMILRQEGGGHVS